jgi:ribosomal protein S18 acetylase RimI-like enzyme
MENQDGEFLLDTRDGKIIDLFNEMEDSEDIDADRYLSLPDWGPKDGYRLMEKFAASLKNPCLRQELSGALNKNKGVFRAYRDVLGQYPETEKQWHKFKEQKMKNEVIAWYNALREEWGLQPIGSEPEDTSSLVFEDFVIKELNAFCFITETANGDLAGSINANLEGKILHINALEVKPEYRGMGIGKILLAKLIEKSDEQKLDVIIDLPSDADFFARSLLLENFKPVMQRFVRKKNI